MAAPGTGEQPDDHFYADSHDILIHGLIGDDQHLGTCSSMPVLYIALGRRLGYPLKLVKAKGHLFMRWDSPTEKFDMDATSKGVSHYSDEECKQWPFPLSETDIKDEDYLKSLSVKEELSVFLSIRGGNARLITNSLAMHWRGFQPRLQTCADMERQPESDVLASSCQTRSPCDLCASNNSQ